MKMPPPPVENKPSDLLNDEDNQKIFRLLGNRCQTIATGVIQLFGTEPPTHTQWVKRDCGVLCFVKDNIKKNYFFRMFCPRRNQMLWEHEMYNNMEYKQAMPFLHTFEGEECMIAFNFSSLEEAKSFHQVVEHKVNARKRKEEKVRLRRQQQNSTGGGGIGSGGTVNRSPHANNDSISRHKKVVDLAAKQAKRKRNITKADIGIPLEFRHVSHVGWNPDSGFDVNIQDENLKKFFEKAGVSEKQLQDRDTREFIYDFIAKHGGRDAVLENTTSNNNISAPPPVQTKAPPPAPPISQSASETSSGPPIPPRGSVRSHVRAAPPPPPTTKKPVVNSAPPQPPPAPPSDFTPPVPPPLPSDLNNIPPPPNMSFLSGGGGMLSSTDSNRGPLNTAPVDLNSALMESIRQGATLRPVEDRKMPTTPTDDSRSDLMNEIKKGIKLKPVDEREVKPVNHLVEQGGNDLAGALARALAERSKAIHSEDDDDDEDSNDDEWED